jgi:hypothetical protein
MDDKSDEKKAFWHGYVPLSVRRQAFANGKKKRRDEEHRKERERQCEIDSILAPDQKEKSVVKTRSKKHRHPVTHLYHHEVENTGTLGGLDSQIITD